MATKRLKPDTPSRRFNVVPTFDEITKSKPERSLTVALRKTWDFVKAEIFYLKGLELDAGHLGINEYLGELYVQTDRIELAKERLQVLKGCKCEEYDELKELIEKN